MNKCEHCIKLGDGKVTCPFCGAVDFWERPEDGHSNGIMKCSECMEHFKWERHIIITYVTEQLDLREKKP